MWLLRRLRVLLACLPLAFAGGPALAAAPVILVLGDSLSAEYGQPRDTGWVKLLERKLAEEKREYRVVNASISGETTAGGRTRLPALLSQHRPAIVIIELGGNDGLRGLSLSAFRANLDAMVAAAQQTGARVLVVGVRVPPNYGREYSERFHAVFATVAKERKAALLPFLLEGFGEDLAYFQPDRIHPNERAQPRMLANVWPALTPLLGARR